MPSQGTRPLPAASAPAALPNATVASAVEVALARLPLPPNASVATGNAAPSRIVGGTMISAANKASTASPTPKVAPQVRYKPNCQSG